MTSPLETHDSARTAGQRVADGIAAAVGSWAFILGQSALLAAWLAYNSLAHRPFDPAPFILLNLALSFQAAFTGPIVLLSANRAAQRDRDLARHDYAVNVQAEQELRRALAHLAAISERLEERETWKCSIR